MYHCYWDRMDLDPGIGKRPFLSTRRQAVWIGVTAVASDLDVKSALPI